ncbi:MAG: hypothetical protein Q8939_05835 [Bacteroidota bacterium]|nr:hypothetical protein [Bacteroidota bacterium]
MRTMLLFVILISSLTLKAQTFLPTGIMGYTQRIVFGNTSYSFENTANKKWSLSTYSGISTGFSFFNGFDGSFLAAPLGLQLNRRLNNNLYAFAGVSAAPAYINFNRSFLSANVHPWNPNNGFLNSGDLGMSAGAELGLIYVNDAKTFSFSGSFSVQRSSYPAFPYQQMNAAKPNRVIQEKR